MTSFAGLVGGGSHFYSSIRRSGFRQTHLVVTLDGPSPTFELGQFGRLDSAYKVHGHRGWYPSRLINCGTMFCGCKLNLNSTRGFVELGRKKLPTKMGKHSQAVFFANWILYHPLNRHCLSSGSCLVSLKWDALNLGNSLIRCRLAKRGGDYR